MEREETSSTKSPLVRDQDGEALEIEKKIITRVPSTKEKKEVKKEKQLEGFEWIVGGTFVREVVKKEEKKENESKGTKPFYLGQRDMSWEEKSMRRRL